MKQLFFSTIILLALLLGACTKDTDTDKPQITVSTPANEAAFAAGDTIWFTATFTDDTELGSYKIDIHNNGDGHSHKSMQADSTAWVYEMAFDFEKGKKTVEVQKQAIVIPKSIGGKPLKIGHYDFLVYCSDAAGNENFHNTEIDID